MSKNKKGYLGPIGAFLLILVLAVAIVAIINPKSNSDAKKYLAPEQKLAVDFVNENKSKNIDEVIANYSGVESDAKKLIDENILDKETSLFMKKIKASGKVVEFVKGNDGYNKGSFIMITDGGHKIKVHADPINEALDLTEKVEIEGKLASPISNLDNLFIRDSLVIIK